MLKQTGLGLAIVLASASAFADPPPAPPANNVLVIPGPTSAPQPQPIATQPPSAPPPATTQPPPPPATNDRRPPPNTWLQDPYPPRYAPQYGRPAYLEPLPPPLPPHHRAPRTALWVGVRGGYEAPLGTAVSGPTATNYPERNFVGPGPAIEFDLGGRFGRDFMPFAFIQSTSAKAGNGAITPETQDPSGLVGSTRPFHVTSSSTTVFGFGLRYAFNPDNIVGFAAEIDWAYRKTSATFSDGTKYRATGPGVIRLGVGADVRVNDVLTIDPMFVLSAGSYSDVTVQAPGGTELSVAGDADTFAYVGFLVGAHFDLFGRQ